MLGYRELRLTWNDWVRDIDEIADEPFSYTSYSFNDFVQSSVDRAILGKPAGPDAPKPIRVT